MHPLLLTFAFLMMMTTLVTTEIKRFHSHATQDHLFHDYLSSRGVAEYETTLSNFQALRDKTPEVKQRPDPDPEKLKKEKRKRASCLRSLKFDLATPPNNSRLNFRTLLFDDEKKLYNTGLYLLQILYGQTSSFQKDSMLASKILDALILKRESTKGFIFADELAKLELEEGLQEVFSLILRGGLDEWGNRILPLTDFITFDDVKIAKVNLLFASAEVLEAILCDRGVVNELMKLKSKLWATIIEQEENRKKLTEEEWLRRTDIKNDLMASFAERISSGGKDPEVFAKQFDFTLGKSGNYLMTTDPKTGLPIREKLLKVESSKQNSKETTALEIIN